MGEGFASMLVFGLAGRVSQAVRQESHFSFPSPRVSFPPFSALRGEVTRSMSGGQSTGCGACWLSPPQQPPPPTLAAHGTLTPSPTSQTPRRCASELGACGPEAWILCSRPQSAQKTPQGVWLCHGGGASDHKLLLVPQMSWANLRATFPTLSPAQLHRLLTQYQLASAVGPMSAWEPGAQDSPDAFKSGEPPRGAGARGPMCRAGVKGSLPRDFEEPPWGLRGARRASATSALGHLPPGAPRPVPHLGTGDPPQVGGQSLQSS